MSTGAGFSEINTPYSTKPFTPRVVNDPTKSPMAVKIMFKYYLVVPYPVFYKTAKSTTTQCWRTAVMSPPQTLPVEKQNW